MKSRRDAERAVELCKQRESLHKLAGSIRLADEVAVSDPNEKTGPNYHHRPLANPLFRFTHCVDELRDLIKREAAEQIAEIDKELTALGVVPDEFEAAAPDVSDGGDQKRRISIKRIA